MATTEQRLSALEAIFSNQTPQRFWQGMSKATALDLLDKIMVGKNNDGSAKYADINQIVNLASIIGGSGFKANVTPASSPIVSATPVYYIGTPGAYPNFGGVEITGAAGIIGQIGTDFTVTNINVDLSGYAEKQELLPDYLSDKMELYSSQELQIIGAIKKLSIQPIADEVDDEWIILLVTTMPTTADLIGDYNYSIVIRNKSAGANWDIVKHTSNLTDIAGVKYYSGEIYYPYANGVLKYSAAVDWNKLPSVFEFNSNSSKIAIKPGVQDDYADLLNVLSLDKVPSYIKDKSFPYYSADALKVIDAISVFDIKVPNDQKGHDWRISLVATGIVPPLDSTYNFTIQVRNITTSDIYNVVQYIQPAIVYGNIQGKSGYQNRKWTADGLKFIDFNIIIDWTKLGAIFQYYPTTSELKINVGNSDVNSAFVAGSYDNDIRFPGSKLNKKDIVFFGNSILSLSYDLPAAILKNGGFYKKEAISSSCARSGTSKISLTNKIPWPVMLRAMGDAVADKVYILEHWDDTFRQYCTLDPPMRSYFDGQHEVEAIQMGITDAEFYILCSYENVLVPYLNGTKTMPSLFIFNHAYNDAKPWETYETVEEFTTQPVIRNDKSTYLGAMNFYIDLILKANPYSRIAILGHYENQLRPRISLSQEELSRYWQLPILKTWEKTGWSQNRIPDTQHLWVDDAGRAAYAGSDGTDPTKDFTVLNWWLPDNIHPATSSQAQNLLLDIYAQWLSTLY
ncbi:MULTISPECIES: hypothetical protein [unclassified Pedobacter]|uniref:hypothetical protein n=1 Tax=unclassified Pedobacter TaxID=2628915 RepID=UPI00142387C4|nr:MULTISPECIES: hypothetical protein [unclassified Pedobacter]NII81756.1 hypothetical protein [Pedobacter sp. SG908]NMN35758.1 hypothetical protein [Pedobacter sp. SG918]